MAWLFVFSICHKSAFRAPLVFTSIRHVKALTLAAGPSALRLGTITKDSAKALPESFAGFEFQRSASLHTKQTTKRDRHIEQG
jgi:hypothetical protein